mgnify:CR=1 FL=1
MKKKQSIKCDVDSCKYNKNSQECDLEEIKVSSNCDCPKDEVCNQEQTVCSSYEKQEEEN